MPSLSSHPGRRRVTKPVSVTHGFYQGLAIVAAWTIFGFLLVTILGLPQAIP